MNKAYLENLLAQAKTLGYNDYELAEDLKIRTKESFLKMFPTDFVNAGDVSRLNFKQDIRALDIGSKMEQFKTSKQKLISMLQSKVDLLESREVENPKVPSQFQIREKNLNDKIKFQQNQLNSNDLQLRVSNQEIKQLKEDILKIKKDYDKINRMDKWKNVAFWTIIITLIGGAFLFGFNVGNTKFDEQKNNLVDEVRNLKDSIKTINNQTQKQ